MYSSGNNPNQWQRKRSPTIDTNVQSYIIAHPPCPSPEIFLRREYALCKVFASPEFCKGKFVVVCQCSLSFVICLMAGLQCRVCSKQLLKARFLLFLAVVYERFHQKDYPMPKIITNFPPQIPALPIISYSTVLQYQQCRQLCPQCPHLMLFQPAPLSDLLSCMLTLSMINKRVEKKWKVSLPYKSELSILSWSLRYLCFVSKSLFLPFSWDM